MPGDSWKMLSVTQRNLVRDGLVTRRVEPTVPPRMHYRITELGLSLEAALAGVRAWAEENMAEVDRAERVEPPGARHGRLSGRVRPYRAPTATRPSTVAGNACREAGRRGETTPEPDRCRWSGLSVSRDGDESLGTLCGAPAGGVCGMPGPGLCPARPNPSLGTKQPLASAGANSSLSLHGGLQGAPPPPSQLYASTRL
ncbi:winged helix-turn-helix transcriptional regulator [Streptomyces mutabilis]